MPRRIHIYFLALTFIIAFVCLYASSDKDEQLYEVPLEVALKKMVYQEKLEFLLAPHKNHLGLPLNKEESRLLNEGKMSRTYFQNEKGKIKEVRCYPKTSSTELEEERLATLLDSNPLKKLNQISISCSDDNMEMIYRQVIENDTMLQSENAPHIAESSEEAIVISTIEQCRFPFKPKSVEAAWHVIFHSAIKGLREFYFLDFKKAYENGLLSCDHFVELEDKIMKRRKFKTKGGMKFKDRDQFFEFLAARDSLNLNNIDIEEFFKKADSGGTIEFSYEN